MIVEKSNCKVPQPKKRRLKMALTRKFLSALGIETEKIDEIITAHTDTVNALKEERDKYKADAEKLPGVQQELDQLKEINNGDDEWEQKFKKEHEDFENYKKEVANNEAIRETKEAYRKLLVANKVDEQRIDAILKVTNFNEISLEDGKLKDEDKLTEHIKSEWAGFIKSEGREGAGVDDHPEGDGSMTKEAFEKLSLNDRMAYANEHPTEAAEFLK
jgi:hypothetical protein